MDEDRLIEQFAATAPDHWYLGDGEGMTPEGVAALENFLAEHSKGLLGVLLEDPLRRSLMFLMLVKG